MAFLYPWKDDEEGIESEKVCLYPWKDDEEGIESEKDVFIPRGRR